MKKILIIGGLAIAVVAATAVVVSRGMSARGTASSMVMEVSRQAADSLQAKIDEIKKAAAIPDRPSGASRVELSEAELESYVLYSLKDDIPVQLDSIDVQLSPGTVASDTQLTFTSNGTGNPMVDALVGGTHDLFVKGKLSGARNSGKFDLEEIRVDGIPVPKILIQTLFDKYVKPKYPEADLKEPFELPWGIEEITVGQGKATVAY